MKHVHVVRLLLVLVAAVGLYALIRYYHHARKPHEGFQSSSPGTQLLRPSPLGEAIHGPAAGGGAGARAPQAPPRAIEPVANEQLMPVGGGTGALAPRDPFPQAAKLLPEDLLPKDAANSKWAQVNPAGMGDVKDQNFLTAGHHLGVNTQGSSLRNASWDLRSEPPNPRYRVSIWNMSTVEPDMNRLKLE